MLSPLAYYQFQTVGQLLPQPLPFGSRTNFAFDFSDLGCLPFQRRF